MTNKKNIPPYKSPRNWPILIPQVDLLHRVAWDKGHEAAMEDMRMATALPSASLATPTPATAYTGPAFTAEGLLESLAELEKVVYSEQPPMHPLHGIHVHESAMATKPNLDKPKVVYQPHWIVRWMPKKWRESHISKRQELLNQLHGFVHEPAIFMVTPQPVTDSFGVNLGFTTYNPYLVVHPTLYLKLKAALADGQYDEVQSSLSTRK